MRPNSRRASSATTSTEAPPASAFGSRVMVSAAQPKCDPMPIDAAISHFISIGCSTSSPEKMPCKYRFAASHLWTSSSAKPSAERPRRRSQSPMATSAASATAAARSQRTVRPRRCSGISSIARSLLPANRRICQGLAHFTPPGKLRPQRAPHLAQPGGALRAAHLRRDRRPGNAATADDSHRRAFVPGPGELLGAGERSEEHTSELQSRLHLVCRLLLEKKKKE